MMKLNLVGEYLRYPKFLYLRTLKKTEKYRSQLIEDLLNIRNGLATEARNNKEMLQIYQRFTMNKANPEEMQLANKQFVEFLKSLGLGVIVILPFSPITIPFIVKLGKKYGVDVLPSSFAQPPAQALSPPQKPINISEDNSQKS